MKTLRKILVGLLVISIMAVCFATSAFAVIETEAGKSVTVSFNIESSYGVDGNFEFSNIDLFSSVEFSHESQFIGEISNNKVYIYGKEASASVIKVDVVVATNAKPGDSCEIKFNYEVADREGQMSEWKTISETVVIAEEIPPTSDVAVAVTAAAAVIALGGAVIAGKANRA